MNKIPNNIDQFTKHLTVVRGKKFVGDLNLKRKGSCFGAKSSYK